MLIIKSLSIADLCQNFQSWTPLNIQIYIEGGKKQVDTI